MAAAAAAPARMGMPLGGCWSFSPVLLVWVLGIADRADDVIAPLLADVAKAAAAIWRSSYSSCSPRPGRSHMAGSLAGQSVSQRVTCRRPGNRMINLGRVLLVLAHSSSQASW